MAKKRATKKSIRIRDLDPRKPLLRGRAFTRGLRGIAAIVLGGLNEGTADETQTSVYGTSGNDAPDDDTNADQDHYVGTP
jgi:hypothetical protein